MKNALSCLILVASLMLGCKKSNYQQPEKLGDSWQPTAKNSYWKYDVSSTISSGTSVRTMTGETQLLNGKTYYKFTAQNNKGTNQSAYYGQQNGEYFIYEITFGVNFETLYFKENAAVGETWTYNITAAPGTDYRIIGKIVEKGVQRIVSGKTYNNVVHTQVLIQYGTPGSGVFFDVQTSNFYLVKGIGIIEANGASGASSMKLMEYAIK